jgi:O-glycosyl hydrolase/fibronectin type 3 domain-containing protein
MNYSRVRGRLSAIVSTASLALAALLCGAPAQASTATVSSTTLQTVKGWGAFPSYFRTDWDPNHTFDIFNKTAVQDAIYAMGLTCIRVDVEPRLYVSGTQISDIVLQTQAVNDLVGQINIARGHGVTQYIMSCWSPPAVWKDNGTINGGHLIAADEPYFVNYYVKVLQALNSAGVGLPAAICLQNEPDMSAFYDSCIYTDTQAGKDLWGKMVKDMRAALDVNGMSSVQVFGPEATNTDNDHQMLGGDNFPLLTSDPVLNASLGSYGGHTYGECWWLPLRTGMATYPKDAWITEWSPDSNRYGTTEMDYAVGTFRHIGSNMVDLPYNYWVYWNSWTIGDPTANIAIVGGDQTPIYSKRYWMFKKLWTTVRPGWVVKPMTSDDANYTTSNNSNCSWPPPDGITDTLVDLYAFESQGGTQSCVVLINKTTSTTAMNVNGLRGSTQTTYVSDATRDMATLSSGSLSGGGTTINLAPRSINIMITSGTVAGPAAPTNLTATAGNAQVALSWTASSGATTYNVGRSVTSGGPFATVGGTSSTSYTNTGLTNGMAYYFVVSAANASGTSGNTAAVGATPTNGTTSIDDSVVGSGQNRFNYVSSGWAHCTGCDALCYFGSNSWDATTNDYLTVAFTGTQIKLYGVQDPGHGIGAVSIDGGGETNVDFYSATRAGNVLLWSSPVLASGSHTFKLRVTGSKNGASSNVYVAPDRVDVVSSGAASPPAPPTGLTATAGNTQVALSWMASSGATSYTVKRSTVNGSGYANVATPSATTYTNTGLTNGTTYYFVVSATNSAGTSGNSNQASATPQTGVPPVPTGLTATTGNTQVALSWMASSGATSYTVKRSTVNGSGYANVATGIASTSYTNTGLTNGTTYYFVVAAVNASGSSANSAQVSATPTASTGSIISVNFVGGGPNGNPTAMGSTESAGVVAATRWNSAPGASSASALALTDNTGAATGATVAWSSAATYSTLITESAGNNRMMKGYLDTTNTSTTTVTVSGLGSGYTSNGYDVYAYFDGAGGGVTRSGNYAIGATTIAGTDGGDFSGTFTQANGSAGNYVKFANLTGASFTLSATPLSSPDSILRAPLNAFQIVQHSGPTYTNLTGTVIGTSGSFSGTSSDDKTRAFDNNTSTIFDGPGANGIWTGLDLGTGVTKQITQIRFFPRSGWASRMTGGKFQGSTSATFASGNVDLYTIATQPADGAWTTTTSIASTTPFRYIRYLSPNNGYGNVAEVEFYTSP